VVCDFRVMAEGNGASAFLRSSGAHTARGTQRAARLLGRPVPSIWFCEDVY